MAINGLVSGMKAILAPLKLIPPVLIFGLACFYIDKVQGIADSKTEETLKAVVLGKEMRLHDFFRQSRDLSKSLVSTEAARDYAGYLNRPLSFDEKKEFELVTLRFEELIYHEQERKWGEYYHHLMVSDLSGEILLSPNVGNRKVAGRHSYHVTGGHNIATNPWFEDAKNTVQLSGFHDWSEASHYHQTIMLPLKDGARKTQGVFTIELLITYQLSIIEAPPNLQGSGNILFLALNGRPIVHSQESPSVSLTKESLGKIGETGELFEQVTNHSGREVLRYLRKSNQYPWIIGAEIEILAANGNLKRLEWNLWLGLSLLFSIVAAFYVFTVESSPPKDTSTTEK